MAFDRTAIQTFTSQDPPAWDAVGGQDDAYVGYVADEREGSRMGLAFVHFRKGVQFDFV
jgi:hypothetical protein